jgi:HK97 family phage portal protein
MLIEKIREWRSGSSILSVPQDWLFEALGHRRTGAGVSVTARNVLELSPALRAIRIICEALSMAPASLFEKSENKRVVLHDDPVQYLVHDEPNEMMSAPVFFQTVQLHTLTDGNGYAFIERHTATGRPAALLPLDAAVTRARRENGRFFYETHEAGRTFTLDPADVIHIPWLSWDGVTGESPARVGKRSIGLGMAAEESGARFFGQGMLQNLIIEQTPGTTLQDGALAQLKEAIQSKFGGIANLWKPMILQPGLTARQISVDPDKAQARELRELNVADAARIWGVPLMLLMSLETGAQSYASVEQFELIFTKHTMLPWFVLWEKELKRKLLPRAERTSRFFKFNLDVLMRGDLLSRMQAHEIGIRTGLETVNEGRHIEDRDPYNIPEAESPLIMTSNLGPLSQVGKQPKEPQPAPAAPKRTAAQRLLEHEARKCARQCAAAVARITERFSADRPGLERELTECYSRLSRDFSMFLEFDSRIFATLHRLALENAPDLPSRYEALLLGLLEKTE